MSLASGWRRVRGYEPLRDEPRHRTAPLLLVAGFPRRVLWALSPSAETVHRVSNTRLRDDCGVMLSSTHAGSLKEARAT